jgi:hypothetical protein
LSTKVQQKRGVGRPQEYASTCQEFTSKIITFARQ